MSPSTWLDGLLEVNCPKNTLLYRCTGRHGFQPMIIHFYSNIFSPSVYNVDKVFCFNNSRKYFLNSVLHWHFVTLMRLVCWCEFSGSFIYIYIYTIIHSPKVKKDSTVLSPPQVCKNLTGMKIFVRRFYLEFVFCFLFFTENCVFWQGIFLKLEENFF